MHHIRCMVSTAYMWFIELLNHSNIATDILSVQLRTSSRRICTDEQNDTPYRRSSIAKVRFYSIQINILVDLSMIYQHFSEKFCNRVLNVSTVITKCKASIILTYFLNCRIRPIGPLSLAYWPRGHSAAGAIK